jgi:hypothetical protein
MDSWTAKEAVAEYIKMIQSMVDGFVNGVEMITANTPIQVFSNVISAINAGLNIQSTGPKDTEYVNAALELKGAQTDLTVPLGALNTSLNVTITAANAAGVNTAMVTAINEMYEKLQARIQSAAPTAQGRAVAVLLTNICDFIKRAQVEMSLAILQKIYLPWATDDAVRQNFITKLRSERDIIIDKSLLDVFCSRLENYVRPKLIDMFSTEVGNRGNGFTLGSDELSTWLSLISPSDVRNGSLANIESNLAKLNSLVWAIVTSKNQEGISIAFDDIATLPDNMPRLSSTGLSEVASKNVDKINEVIEAYNASLVKFKESDFRAKIYEFFADKFSNGKNTALMVASGRFWCNSVVGSRMVWRKFSEDLPAAS